MRMSKNFSYENPYTVIGGVKLAGLYENPKVRK